MPPPTWHIHAFTWKSNTDPSRGVFYAIIVEPRKDPFGYSYWTCHLTFVIVSANTRRYDFRRKHDPKLATY